MRRVALAVALVMQVAVAPQLARAAAEGKPALGEVTRAVPDSTPWVVKAPAEARVDFRGAVNFDGAGVPHGGILYPAPSLVGLFAAVLVHGAIADSAQERQKSKIREEADKVLAPYQPALDKLTHVDLVPLGLKQTRRGGEKRLLSVGDTASAWVLETVPVFSMTQDERALVLDNAVLVRSPEAPAVVLYRNVVRVVSAPRPASEDKAALTSAWMADDARLLTQESAALLAESLDLVLGDLARGPAPADGAANVVHRTVRFPEGGTVRMERAAMLAEACDRVVIRTLRGWLMSVPRTSTEACASPTVAAESQAAASSPR